jgi:hypothetical protein
MFPPFPARSLELGERRVPVNLMGFDAGTRAVGPSVVSGRAPAASDEIMLGPVTAKALGLGIGDRVAAWGQTGEWQKPETYRDTTVTMTLVGTGVIPLVGGNRLGSGAVLASSGINRLAGQSTYDSIFVRLAAGADTESVVRELATALNLPPPSARELDELRTLSRDYPLLDVRQINHLPQLLGALMALMAIAVLGHVLVTAVRARRRELALLMTIGFDRRQLRRTIAWQSAAMASIAIVVGVPLGIIVGRLVWLAFAQHLGVVPEAVVPRILLLVPVGILLIAHAIASVPARLATRRSPATVLRAE